MKINRWLDEAQFRPRRTLFINTVAFVVVQTGAWVALGYAVATQSIHLWATFCACVAVAPIYIWATYNSVQRAWKRQPRNDLDESIPAVVVMSLCFLLWMWLWQF